MRSTHAPPYLLTLCCVALAAALAGCERGADTGATANPVEPGRPGTGNGVVQLSPRPESITESPGVGGSRGRIVDGITGRGDSHPGVVPGDNTVRQQPGVGLDGGLGGATAAASAPGGSN